MKRFLTESSSRGFRTLLMAMKVLDEEELDEFKKKLALAEMNLTEGRDEQFAKLYDEFEQDFTLIGGTCVEDRL
jgi:magnesium-transporting ATPase (P-type)